MIAAREGMVTITRGYYNSPLNIPYGKITSCEWSVLVFFLISSSIAILLFIPPLAIRCHHRSFSVICLGFTTSILLWGDKCLNSVALPVRVYCTSTVVSLIYSVLWCWLKTCCLWVIYLSLVLGASSCHVLCNYTKLHFKPDFINLL